MRSLFKLAAALALLAAAGCGARKPVVSGVVTLDGQPLTDGTIEFFPVRGDGQTSGTTLGSDGSYRMEASPTEMKVVIHASKTVGKRKQYADVPDSPTVDIRQEVVPAKYSDMTKTELRFTVAPGTNEKNFELTSDRKK
jgi:hypothetical protein